MRAGPDEVGALRGGGVGEAAVGVEQPTAPRETKVARVDEGAEGARPAEHADLDEISGHVARHLNALANLRVQFGAAKGFVAEALRHLGQSVAHPRADQPIRRFVEHGRRKEEAAARDDAADRRECVVGGVEEDIERGLADLAVRQVAQVADHAVHRSLGGGGEAGRVVGEDEHARAVRAHRGGIVGDLAMAEAGHVELVGRKRLHLANPACLAARPNPH